MIAAMFGRTLAKEHATLTTKIIENQFADILPIEIQSEI